MRTKLILIILFTFLFFNSNISFSEELIQRIDGKVESSDELTRRIVVDYEHPATGEKYEKEFVVREGAGFKDFKKLSQLKKGDLVSLDFVESKPIDIATYVIYVPLDKTYFNHAEIAQAIVQIKTTSKS